MKILENIAYSSLAGSFGTGDLYLPENLSENTCWALCIHGGGWNGMDKSRMVGVASFLCRDLAMAVYNINYRLAGQFPWPAGGDDCLAAAWALLNGEIKDICKYVPGKILIAGGSSGGHYALMTALRLPPEHVSGILSLSGINSVKEDFAFAPGRYKILFGHEPSEEELASIDPLTYLTPQSPPILCTHDTKDNVVPYECTKAFARAADSLHADCRVYSYTKEETGYSHRLFAGNSVRLYPDIENAVRKFICEKIIKYIPEPNPQKSSVEISAFYYPGTEQMAEWDQVEQTLPGIKPLLGWYDESNPEVIDWQIKWAVEHGISSFCVDWYWNQGVQRLDHWVKAFYKARFRRYLKWYIMWANHNEAGAHSTEDQIKLTCFWIENYFRTPEYYTIDGHPVVVIWSAANLDRDFRREYEKKGVILPEGAGVRKAIEICNTEMRKANLPEIYFINMYHGSNYDAEEFQKTLDRGFKQQMIYNIEFKGFHLAPEAAEPGDTEKRFNYDCTLAGSEKWWRLTSSGELQYPLVPLLSTGWNSLPREFDCGRLVYERTPEKYRILCRSCKEFCEKNGHKKIMIAPLNEWQEGSYIEPNEEYGFAMYNAVRDAFCHEPPEGFPADLLPADTGRGPYDYPPMAHLEKTSWDFSSDVQNWYRNPFGTAHIQIVDQALHFFRSGGDRAAIRTRIKPFDAEKFSRFKVMMKVTLNKEAAVSEEKEEKVRLYFGTVSRPLFSKDLHICREGSVWVPAVTDGYWHEYTLVLTENPLWKGWINELWFDPPQASSTYIDIRWMKFEP